MHAALGLKKLRRVSVQTIWRYVCVTIATRLVPLYLDKTPQNIYFSHQLLHDIVRYISRLNLIILVNLRGHLRVIIRVIYRSRWCMFRFSKTV